MTEAKRAMLCARLSVNHTKKTCATVCAVPLLALVIIVAANLFVFNTPTARDYILKSDPRTLLDNAREAAHKQFPYENSGPLSRVDPDNTLTLLLRNTERNAKRSPYKARRVDVNQPGENVLTIEGLAALKRAEDEFTRTPGFERFCFHDRTERDCQGRPRRCALPKSILNHKSLYGKYENNTLCDRRNNTLVSKEHFRRFMDSFSSPSALNRQYLPFFGKDFSKTNDRSQIIRSVIQFGTPIANWTGVTTLEQKNAEYFKWVDPIVERITAMSGKEFHTTLVSSALAKGKFDALARNDFMFASVALWLVFFVAWIHTTSLLLSIITLTQILLAFPLTYLVYRVVLQIKYFAALQIMTIFLILGIGADDVFVFTDAWKQSTVVLGPRSSLEDRMSWTYRRAGRAMGVTSLTTAAAFFVTATSPIMPIATLGAWAGVLVLVQYALVLTLYPCAVIMWHRYWRLRHWKNCLRRDPDEINIELDPPQLINEPTDEVIAAAEVVELPAPTAPPSAVLDLSKLPRTSVLPLAGDGPRRPRTDDLAGKLRRVSSSRIWPTQSFFHSNPAYVGHTKSFFARRKQREDEYRPLEKFFNGAWTSVLRAARWPLVIVGAFLVAGSIYCSTRLNPPSEPEAYLPDGHPVQTGLRLLVEAFPPQEQSPFNTKVQVVWGIKGINRKGTSKYDLEDIGTAELDEKFSLRTAGAQQRLLQACRFFERSHPELLDNRNGVKRSNCWIRDFKKWLREVRGLDGFQNYGTELDFANEVSEFTRWVGTSNNPRPYYHYVKKQRIGFTEGSTKVSFVELEFVSRMPVTSQYKKMWPEYNRWKSALQEFIDGTTVSELKRPFVVGGFPWMWQITQKSLVDNMVVGICVVLAVALVSLSVSTGNWIVSLLALASISGILSNLLALVWFLGWTIGITESIGVVIAVGFSFDYVAHVATAYVESKAGSRLERSRDALTDLGISVVAGAVSTLLAGSMLLAAKVTFFFKFGVFVVATVGLSLVWALLFFPALLHAIGPVGRAGELKNIVAFLCSFRRRRKSPADTSDTRFDIAPDFCGSMPQSGHSFTGSIAEGSLVDSMVAPRSSGGLPQKAGT